MRSKINQPITGKSLFGMFDGSGKADAGFGDAGSARMPCPEV